MELLLISGKTNTNTVYYKHVHNINFVHFLRVTIDLNDQLLSPLQMKMILVYWQWIWSSGKHSVGISIMYIHFVYWIMSYQNKGKKKNQLKAFERICD
jgi:hypothetical protein